MPFRTTIFMVPIALAAGCADPQSPQTTADQRRRLFDSIAAERIQIMAPFTQPASFDDDPIPDGIEVALAALDRQGEPTKIAGQIVFELYSYRRAAADPKGTQIQTWQLALADDQDQQTYWHHATQMYEFPLRVNLSSLPKSRKFVLLARYSNPWNEYLEDQVEIDLSSMVYELKEQLRDSVKPP